MSTILSFLSNHIRTDSFPSPIVKMATKCGFAKRQKWLIYLILKCGVLDIFQNKNLDSLNNFINVVGLSFHLLISEVLQTNNSRSRKINECEDKLTM